MSLNTYVLANMHFHKVLSTLERSPSSIRHFRPHWLPVSTSAAIAVAISIYLGITWLGLSAINKTKSHQINRLRCYVKVQTSTRAKLIYLKQLEFGPHCPEHLLRSFLLSISGPFISFSVTSDVQDPQNLDLEFLRFRRRQEALNAER